MSESVESGSGQASQPSGRSWHSKCPLAFIAIGICGALLVFFLPVQERGLSAPRKTQCRNNLKQIALALKQYETDFGALPPACTIDAEGRPLHSWRTLILPYVDQTSLYNKIDLSKPWDDPTNAWAHEAPVPVFSCPSARCAKKHTVYLANGASGGCFRTEKPRKLADITDGLAKTLLVLEVPEDHAVHWMAPADADDALVLSITAESKLPHSGGFQAALCDGSVRFLSAELSTPTRRALLTIAAGDKTGRF